MKREEEGPRPDSLAISETALGFLSTGRVCRWHRRTDGRVLLELSPTCLDLLVLPSPVFHTQIQGKMA